MDLYDLVISAKLTKHGGGGDIDVDELSVTENGTYTASSGHAYSPVTVSVPGIVPSGTKDISANGVYDVTDFASASVSVPTGVFPSGTSSITSNGIYDITNFASVDVNVSGGGGGSSYTLLHEEDDEVIASSQVVTVNTITLSEFYTSDLLFVRIRDKAGRRQGYFLESEAYIANPNPKNGTTSDFYTFGRITIYDDGGTLKIDNGQYGGFGVYATDINSNGDLTIQARAGRGNVDGTYHIEVYKLALPDGSSSPFPTV